MIELEHQAKQTSQILFYVVNEQTRNVASMIDEIRVDEITPISMKNR